VIRTAAMMVTAKLIGFLEAYSFTPEIIGARLGLTKVQIIAAILVWAVGAGFFGMIWGILISLAFQAALRLSHEVEAGMVREAEVEAAE
jgi:predicted PurR-regulated permease PerM